MFAGEHFFLFVEIENQLYAKPRARISLKIAPHDRLGGLVMWCNFQGNPSFRLHEKSIFNFPKIRRVGTDSTKKNRGGSVPTQRKKGFFFRGFIGSIIWSY